jgi:hypothetical protein
MVFNAFRNGQMVMSTKETGFLGYPTEKAYFIVSTETSTKANSTVERK